MICKYARMLMSVLILPVGLCFCACNGCDGDNGDDTDTSAADCTVEKIAADSPTGYGEILGLPSGDIYVLGAGLRHFDGSTWNLVSTGDPPMSLYSVWGTSNSDLFVIGCTSQGQTESLIRHYDGQTWTDMEHPGPYEKIIAIWGAASNDVFAIAESLGGNAVLHYDGQAWTEMHTGIDSFEKHPPTRVRVLRSPCSQTNEDGP